MQSLLIALPLFACVLVLLGVVRGGWRRGLADGLLNTTIIIFTFIALSTELLSIFGAITFGYLLSVWVLLCLTCLILVIRNRHRAARTDVQESDQPLSTFSRFLLAGIALILVTTFVTAVVYPPNNWDSMTYHMARVSHWISNGSIEFYPTHISRQLWQMPLAEYAILHLQLLTGSDLFANLIQWGCFVVLIAEGALLARELGFGRKEQIISAAVVATIPMAILQSSSTQNDLVVAVFVASFVLYMLRLQKEFTMVNVTFASLSLGLALLTKGTAFIYCAPLGVVLVIPLLLAVRSDLRQFMRRVGLISLIVIVALVMNSGHFIRTYNYYGTPVTSDGYQLWNEDRSPQALLASIPRSIMLHLGTPSHELNHLMYRGMRRVIGTHQLNNPDNTSSEFGISYSRHEDTAGNPIHMLCLLVVLIWIGRQQPSRIWYTVSLVAAASLFIMYLRWQPWGSRLHTPLFVLAAPVITIGLSRLSRSRAWFIASAVLVLMVGYGLFISLTNESRSLLTSDWYSTDRTRLYFTNAPDSYESYRAVIDKIQQTGEQEVGLYIGGDSWEYPLWVMAEKGATPIRFRHVGVAEPAKNQLSSTEDPDYVIATEALDTWSAAAQYCNVYSSPNLNLWKRCIQLNRKGESAE